MRRTPNNFGTASGADARAIGNVYLAVRAHQGLHAGKITILLGAWQFLPVPLPSRALLAERFDFDGGDCAILILVNLPVSRRKRFYPIHGELL